jgi:hypothetical protein
MKRTALILSFGVLAACTSPDQSFFIYRLPYEDGTDVKVWQDHLTPAVRRRLRRTE